MDFLFSTLILGLKVKQSFASLKKSVARHGKLCYSNLSMSLHLHRYRLILPSIKTTSLQKLLEMYSKRHLKILIFRGQFSSGIPTVVYFQVTSIKFTMLPMLLCGEHILKGLKRRKKISVRSLNMLRAFMSVIIILTIRDLLS